MPDFHDQIEPYLQGTLSDQERLAFEALMQADPSLARDFALYQQARESLVGQFGEEVDTTEIRRLIMERERAYLANRLRLRIAMWVVVLGVVTAGVLFSWQPWKGARGPIQGTAEHPCFDYDFTEGPLDTSVWEIRQILHEGRLAVEDGYLRLVIGATGGYATVRLKNLKFTGDIEGVVELGQIEMGNGYRRQGRIDLVVTGDDMWEVPELTFLGSRNRLQHYNNGRDVVTDLVGQGFTPKQFYKFRRSGDTFILAHANNREGPYAEMERHVASGFFDTFNYLELSAGAGPDLGPVLVEIGRITVFNGCVWE
ncbi:MAG: hypothetical protein R3301_05600 [Saprospiraceae bacterium]|nr:hypothetical protein [Saprospiraceae bacterium]